MDNNGLSPAKLLQFASSYRVSKVLFTAVELGLFTLLDDGKLSYNDLIKKIGIQKRGARDFFDTLVSLDLLEREEDYYSNSKLSSTYLNKNRPEYIGGLMDMYNLRLYSFWGHLTEALKTGLPQNEIKSGQSLFEALRTKPKKIRSFIMGMTGVSLGSAKVLADKINWDKYGSFADIGTAQGVVPVQLLQKYPKLSGIGFDLPEVQPIFEEYVTSFSLTKPPQFIGGTFLVISFPRLT